MEPIILRGIERLLGVIVGGGSIYLGYRLFIELPKLTDSSGKIILPGGVSVFLSRIGPGAFFALFGAVLVAVSFRSAIQMDLPVPVRADTNAVDVDANGRTPMGRFVGADGGVRRADDVNLQERRSEAYGMIEVLNQLPASLSGNLPAEKRVDIRRALRESKLALIESVWGSDWGDFAAFRSWLEGGEATPVPATFAAPAQLFHKGETAEP